MSSHLDSLKTELERFGRSNDQLHPERGLRMLNITRDTGEFLALQARRILEIGTSNGYSTLWLVEAAQAVGGSVTTVELSESKVRLPGRPSPTRASRTSSGSCTRRQATSWIAVGLRPTTWCSWIRSGPNTPAGGPDSGA